MKYRQTGIYSSSLGPEANREKLSLGDIVRIVFKRETLMQRIRNEKKREGARRR